MTRSELSCPHGNIACGDPGSPYMAQCQLCDAADEIERLQQEINDLRHQIITLTIPKETP